jgi:hypothetical protein
MRNVTRSAAGVVERIDSGTMRSRFMSQEALNPKSTQSPQSSGGRDAKAAPVVERAGSPRHGSQEFRGSEHRESAEVLTLFGGLRSHGVNSAQMSQDLVRINESQDFPREIDVIADENAEAEFNLGAYDE